MVDSGCPEGAGGRALDTVLGVVRMNLYSRIPARTSHCRLLIPLLAIVLALLLPSAAHGVAPPKGPDFNGDGRADVGVAYAYEPSAGKLGISAFQSTGGSSPGLTWRNLWTAKDGFDLSRGQTVAQDVDGDGRAEVVMLYSYGGDSSAMFVWEEVPRRAFDVGSGPFSWMIAKQFTALDATKAKLTLRKRSIVDIAYRTWPAAGTFEPVMLYDCGRDTMRYITFVVSQGPRFSYCYRSDLLNFDWHRSTPLGGDFDGDGSGDFAIVYDYGGATTGIWVVDGRRQARNVWWRSLPRGFDATKAKWAAGDFNADGRDDIAALYDAGNGRVKVFVFTSQVTRFDAGQWSEARDIVPDWTTTQVTASDVSCDGRADLVLFGARSSSASGIWAYVSAGMRMANRGDPVELARLERWSYYRSQLIR